MKSDDFESAVAKAASYNQRLDERLRRTGVVDAALFEDFASVEADPNASSVGWLQAKLGVLQGRVASGGELSLHDPLCGTSVVVTTVEQLVAWADRHLPVARLRS